MEKSIHYKYPQRSPEWFNIRKRLITASKLGFLIYAKTEEQKILAAKQILGIEVVEFTPEQIENMRVGTEHENDVRDYYSKTRELEIDEVGIFVSKEYPFLGGSPDGMLKNGDIIEIKISNKDVPISYSNDFSEIYRPYLYQMQLNCFLTGAKNCHFIFYSRKSGKLYTRTVQFDIEFFTNNILIPTIDFYEKYLIPLIKNEH